MLTSLFDIGTIYTVMLVFARAGGLLALLPAFSAQGVPVVVRISLALALACLISGMDGVSATVPTHFMFVVLGIGHEVVVGLLMGLAVRLVFYTVEMAGQIMATQVGLMMTSSLDPTTQGQSSPITIALSYLGIVIFFASGAHQFVFVAFIRSFELLPAAAGNFDPGVVDVVIRESGKMFLLGVQMAAPLIAINFIVNFSLALLNRAAPTVNAFLLSMPMQIVAGLAMLGMVMVLTAHHVLRALDGVPELMLRFIY